MGTVVIKSSFKTPDKGRIGVSLSALEQKASTTLWDPSGQGLDIVVSGPWPYFLPHSYNIPHFFSLNKHNLPSSTIFLHSRSRFYNLSIQCFGPHNSLVCVCWQGRSSCPVIIGCLGEGLGGWNSLWKPCRGQVRIFLIFPLTCFRMF